VADRQILLVVIEVQKSWLAEVMGTGIDIGICKVRR
jgi:hypothetical protein